MCVSVCLRVSIKCACICAFVRERVCVYAYVCACIQLCIYSFVKIIDNYIRNVGHDFPSFNYKVITLMIGPPNFSSLRFYVKINLQEFPAKKFPNYIYNMYQCPCKQLIVMNYINH